MMSGFLEKLELHNNRYTCTWNRHR